MIKVTYYDMGDITYNSPELRDDPDIEHEQIKRTKTFKSIILACIFIFFCRFIWDYIEVEGDLDLDG